MAVTWQMLLIVCPLVFLAALVDAVAGGGGLISLPAYYLAGLPPVMAAGSNKFSACLSTVVASAKFYRSGKMHIQPGLCAVAGALPGAYVGAELLKRTPEDVVRLMVLICIPVAAALMLIRVKNTADERPVTRGGLFLCGLIGLSCGLYDGFFGPGTGTFLILLFRGFLHMDMVGASATAKLVNLASNLSALTSLLFGSNVLFALAIPATCCSMLGAYVGASLAIKRGANFIRYMMYAVLALLLIKLARDFFFA